MTILATASARPLRVLVTGASGFVGRHLLGHLAEHTAWQVRAAGRSNPAPATPGTTFFRHDDLATEPDWRRGVADIDVVIHLAARVHVMKDAADDSTELFRRVNVAATERLARDAAAAGVRRFVFVSSVKVNGESTPPGIPFRPADRPRPNDAYGASKLEAELALRDIAERSAMEAVIVRPCLVYGPGVGANFSALMRWLRKPVPLPFGAIRNARSLLAVENLCSLLTACAAHPAASGEVFLASDGEDVSTTELMRHLGAALSSPALLLPVPETLLRAGLSLLGRTDLGRRLCDSLTVDNSAAANLLGWRPVVSLDEALRQTAQAFLASVTERRH